MKKVVWLCHFINREINDYFGTDLKELAPWITDFIEIFVENSDIQLTIIAPNYYTNTNVNFSLRGVNYFFFKYYSGVIPQKIALVEASLLQDYFAVKNVSKCVKRICPDLIHLFGSENLFYSKTILQFKEDFPVLISLQGFISNAPQSKNRITNFVLNYRKKIEKKINSEFSCFSLPEVNSKSKLFSFNPFAKVFYFPFPTRQPKGSIDPCTRKNYDIVFWGRVTKNKGIEDLIYAIKKIKEKYHEDLSALIIGSVNSTYMVYLKSLVSRLNLLDNVTFTGFLETQDEVFQLGVQGKVYVLPTYFDGMPGSIREAMFLKIPVVAYDIGGIPLFNLDKECITLAEYRNISDLSAKILLVLQDQDRTKRISLNAFNLVKEKYSYDRIKEKVLHIYDKIASI